MIATVLLTVVVTALPQEPAQSEGLLQLQPNMPPKWNGDQAPAPSEERALYPWLATGPTGRVSANWLQPELEGDITLLWAQRKMDGNWTEPEPIAVSKNFFVNWADHPMHAIDEQGRTFVTWLKKVPGENYSYHVMTRQRDANGSWSEPRLLHEDNSPTEHGFVSLAAVPAGGFIVAWLDGRATTNAQPMQLRARRVLPDGDFGPEILVDDRVCDCCGTTITHQGENRFSLAYRDRSEEEIRDLGIAQLTLNGHDRLRKITTSAPSDGWIMPGCPVNGPASTLWAGEPAVVWFTAHPNPRIRLARGRSNTIVRNERGVMGRVSCAVSGEQLAVSWLETKNNNASWWIQWFRIDDGRLHPSTTACPITSATGARADGFLRLASAPNGVLALWTETKAQRLRSTLLKYPQ
ncbi:MAG: hypothetical protein MK209_06400 [Planctomycetes bacterium]|nr:hypothetical protein [Planctomycetota bacterium]